MSRQILINKNRIDENNPIHFVKKYLILKYIRAINRENKLNIIADLGCGTGLLSKEFVKLCKVDAFDIDKKIIKFANEIHGNKDIHYYLQNINNINKYNYYDLAVCSEVLIYIKDDVDVLKKINKIIKPSGYLILTVPINKKFITEFDKREKFIRRYSIKDITGKLKKNNFSIIKTKFWGYPFLNMFYLYVYISRSNREARNKNKDYKISNWIIFLLKYIRYFFLIDLFFNNSKSMDVLIIAKKNS